MKHVFAVLSPPSIQPTNHCKLFKTISFDIGSEVAVVTHTVFKLKFKSNTRSCRVEILVGETVWAVAEASAPPRSQNVVIIHHNHVRNVLSYGQLATNWLFQLQSKTQTGY